MNHILPSEYEAQQAHQLIARIRWVAWHNMTDAEGQMREIRDLLLEYDGLLDEGGDQ